jgi:hypothetical protein
LQGAELVSSILSGILSLVGVAAFISFVAGAWRSSKAEARASALLRNSLSAGELQQLDATGYLNIPSPGRPGRVYRVPAHHDQVEIHESGRISGWLCVQPVGWLPVSDVVLMHKLMIEGNEEEYLRVANIYRHEYQDA